MNWDLLLVTGRNKVALPNAALSNKCYLVFMDVDNMFVDMMVGFRFNRSSV